MLSMTPKTRKPLLIALTLTCAVALAAGVLTFTPTNRAEAAESLAKLENLSDGFAAVAEKASPAVVFIRLEKEMNAPQMAPFGQGSPFEDFFEQFFGPGMQGPRGGQGVPRRGVPRQPQQQRGPIQYGQGSGFIVSEDGYIITNNHVVDDADKVTVTLSDGREFEAEVVGSDPLTEVALIKIDGDGLPTLSLGDSDKLRVGEWVVAIGNPFGLSHTVTAGIVSAQGRSQEVGLTKYADFIQTDAAINPGNSGGPLLNLKGEVIGLNTAIFSRSGGYMGIGFAIPVNMVKYITDQLREHGTVARGFLGVMIQDLTPDLAESFGLDNGQGVLLGSVMEDGPAAQAGLERGDVVLEYNGQPVTDVGTFQSRVASTAPGSKAPIVVLRDGKKLNKTVEIGTLNEEQMAQTGVGVSAGPAGTTQSLGMAVQNLTDDIAERLGLEGESGVVVSQVKAGSDAARNGVKPGVLIQEVNRQPVKNVNEFREAVENADHDKAVLLLVLDGEYSRYVALRFEE